MGTREEGKSIWTRVVSYDEFCRLFAGRELAADDMRFTIHRDGRIEGAIGDAILIGSWTWEDGYFCRTARLDNDDLGTDCELIESDGHRMRYSSARGTGDSTIVS